MKKILMVVFGLMVSQLANAAEYDLAVIAGSPSEKYNYVTDILKERLTFENSRNSSIEEYTDGIFYFAWKNHVNSAMSVEILSAQGSALVGVLAKGIEESAGRSNVVLITVGPPRESTCQLMAKFPQTVFLAGLGSDGVEFDDTKIPSCHADNILFVAGLNGALTELAPNQSWSKVLRLGVPYMNLRSPVDGRISRSLGMGIVAGKLAALKAANPELSGAELVNKFLESSTIFMPGLEGKVKGSRGLVDFEQ